MAEAHPSKSERKRERQPISVPFIWEEIPGVPKKDWKPLSRQIDPPPPPVNFVVSIPFEWEEKPGTPLPSFVQAPQELQLVPVPQAFLLQPSKYSSTYCCDEDQSGNEVDDESSELELDTCSMETDDSFSSAKSLLANGLISTTAISRAVPVQETSLALVTTDSTLLHSPGSPASETDCASSFATGPTSLAGDSFLEWLFPLLVPNSHVPNLGYLESAPSQNTVIQNKEYLHGSNFMQGGRPLLTLGDLIAMSRRRSCQRKVNKMRKQPSMDFVKRNAFGCCIFGNSNGINQLPLKWKRQLQLKLT